MTLFYRAVRQALVAALELYYVDIQATGLERVPTHGPVIFAANHPNSIMDTVILGSQTSRTIHFLARSGLFRNPLAATIFKLGGVIPIYRSQDGPGQTHRNQDSFRRAYDLLLEGGCIGIFPEGRNSDERAVQEIKTGTARIALGAEALDDYEADLKIIPVGLNFENRDAFLSSVLVRFGEPIHVADWADEHQRDPRAAVRGLTDHLLEGLRQEATHIQDAIVRDLTQDIIDIAGREMLQSLIGQWQIPRTLTDMFFDELRATPGPREDLDDRFRLRQSVADTLTRMRRESPQRFVQLRRRVRAYKGHLQQVGLHHDLLRRSPARASLRLESLKLTLYAIAFAPVALWGFIHNLPPYALTWLAARLAPDEPQRAIRGFGVGLVLFPLWYLLIGWLNFESTRSILWTSLYLLSLPPAGFFFLRYRRQLLRYQDKILTRTLFLTNRALIRRLLAERARLLGALRSFSDEVLMDDLKS